MKKNLLWRVITLLIVLVISLIFPLKPSWGITNDECNQRAEKKELDLLSFEDLTTCSNFFNQSLQSISSQRASLELEIKRFNAAILVTSTNILATTKQIENLEKEISSLTNKIGQLDVSLDKLSEILARRITETYKKGKVDFVSLFLSSQNFADFISRFKYLRVVQLHDRSLMIQMETARTNFEDQKTLKEQKQEELEAAKKKLESQKLLLAQQKAAKDNLLAITKNDEKKYQQFLAQAVAQQKAFQRFVAGQGGASILENQTVCDDWGCYYNQRDSQWGRMSLGISGLSVAEYGCLVSSVAMVASYYKINIKPSDIASNPSAFFSETGYLLHSFSVNGVNVRIEAVSKSLLDGELSKGKPVIAGLYSGPDHFIVIKEKSGDNYIMNDPFLENGANRLLSDKYSVSDITSLRLVSF